ncbi:MAG: hypothetical protein GY940_33290 [bacterium]|nr:hypothetical protein [bacterium]
MLRLLKVKGDSLMPDYRQGDFVVTFKAPFFKNRFLKGDVVVFHHPRLGLLIKKVDGVSGDGARLTVKGTHPSSIDSRDFGPVDTRNTIGKVIYHIKSPK